jgi:hypothetical protein
MTTDPRRARQTFAEDPLIFVLGDLKLLEQIFEVVFSDQIASTDLLGRKQTFADPSANGGCADTSF